MCRPVKAADAPQRDEKSLNLCGKVLSPSSFQDHQVDEQATEGENMTVIRDNKADETSKEAVQHKINLPPKLTVQQKNLYGDDKTLKRDNETSPTPGGDNGIRNPRGESDESLKRGHDKHLPPFGEDDNTPHGNGDITLNRDTNSHSVSIEEQQNNVHTPCYSGPMTSILKGGMQNHLRSNIECLLTFIPDRKRREEDRRKQNRYSLK